MLGQTKKHSAYESITNIFIGYTVNILANFMIFPIFGWHITLEQNLIIGVFYTVVSFFRSFLIRRVYNRIHYDVNELN